MLIRIHPRGKANCSEVIHAIDRLSSAFRLGQGRKHQRRQEQDDQPGKAQAGYGQTFAAQFPLAIADLHQGDSAEDPADDGSDARAKTQNAHHPRSNRQPARLRRRRHRGRGGKRRRRQAR